MNEGKDDYQVRLELLRARAEAARLAARLRQAEWDLGTANEESRILRESIAFGIGRSVIEALRSPRNLMALPLRIAGLARRARRGAASEDVSSPASVRKEPAQLQAGTAAPCTESARLEAADDKPAALAGLRVAGVLDVFSADSFAPDCQLTLLRADTWVEQMRIARPHLLLVESCWHGPDRTWEGLVSRPSDALRALVDACREAGIPTVFWNKEDPLHYEAFVESAKLFDCVLTTDADCIPKYRHDLGHGRIYLMPFALQPKVFHPVNAGKRSDAFFFAGAYYPHLVERSNDFRSVVDTLGLVAPVHIYDRNHGLASANGLTYPAAYRRMLRGGVAYAGIADLYRSYSSGININTIKQSPTMFARRVLELIGCGCGVYGNYSTGIANLFGELVVASDDQEELLRQAWRALRVEGGDFEHRRVAALRKALTEHTYAHRLAYLAEKTGFELEVPALPQLVVLARADSIEELDCILVSFARQSLVPDMLLLDAPEHLRAHVPAGAVVLSKDELGIPLPDRLPGAWVAPMCPDDYYGEHYLADLLLATRYSAATGIGKAAYCRAGSDDVENAGLEYREVERLAMRRMIMATQTWSGSVGELLDTLRTGELHHACAISIDHLNYVEGGGAAAQVEQPLFHEGVAMADALEFAESMGEWVPPAPEMAFDATRLMNAFLSGVIPEGHFRGHQARTGRAMRQASAAGGSNPSDAAYRGRGAGSQWQVASLHRRSA